MARPQALKYYVVDQEQGGLWRPVYETRDKAGAEAFAAGVPGRTRIVYTYPTARWLVQREPGKKRSLAEEVGKAVKAAQEAREAGKPRALTTRMAKLKELSSEAFSVRDYAMHDAIERELSVFKVALRRLKEEVASRHREGGNPLTIGEKARMRVGALPPKAARAALTRERGALQEFVEAARALETQVQACLKCDPRAERKAKAEIAKARKRLVDVEKIARYTMKDEVAERHIDRLRRSIEQAEARLRGVSLPEREEPRMTAAETHLEGDNPKTRKKAKKRGKKKALRKKTLPKSESAADRALKQRVRKLIGK